MAVLKRFLTCTSGAAAVEYSLLAALIAVVIVAAVTNIGKNVSRKFGTIATALS